MKEFYYRLLNLISNWYNGVEFIYSDDIALIRERAPHLGIILDAEEPIQVSPGVYLIRGHYIGGKRMCRYNCSVVGDEVIIEAYAY